MPKPILLVDDAQDGLFALAQDLAASGYSPLLLPAGGIAVEHFIASHPELVFVSLAVPEPTVICEGIRAEPDGAIVPIVLVGNDHPEIHSPADALNQGADYFFELPIDTNKVLSKVATYIGPGEKTSGEIVVLDVGAASGDVTPSINASATTPMVPLAPPAIPAVASSQASPATPTPSVAPVVVASAVAAPAVGLPPLPSFGTWDRSAALLDQVPATLPVEVASVNERPSPPVLTQPVSVSVAPASAVVSVAPVPQPPTPVAPVAASVFPPAPAAVAVESRSSPVLPQEPTAEDRARISAENARRAEEEAWRRTQQELQRHADEEARRRADDDARRRIEEETRQRLEGEIRRKYEEETRRKLEEELRHRLEDDMRRKLEEEARHRIEEETRRRLEEEAQRRSDALAAEAELRRRIEEDLRRQMGLSAPTAPVVEARAPIGSPATATPVAAISSSAASPAATSPVVEGPPMQELSPAEGLIEPSGDIAAWLCSLHQKKVTGRVDFSSKGRQRSVFFEQGLPVDAYSSQVYDRIEEYLLREGRITRAQYQDVRVKALRTPQRIATYVARQGYLKAEEVLAAVRGHLRETLFGLLEWDDTAYRYTPERASAEDHVILDDDFRAMLAEGIRRKYLLPRMMSRIGGLDSVLALNVPASDLGALKLDAVEIAVAQLLDGTRNLEEVVLASGLEALRVYHVATALVATEMAEVSVRGLGAAAHGGASNVDAIDHARIGDKLEQVRNLDYFQILGVSRSATPFEIERAYERVSGEFHPARFSTGTQDELRGPLTEIVLVLGEARLVLSNEALRDSYARNIAG